jgi:hypothetical protein
MDVWREEASAVPTSPAGLPSVGVRVYRPEKGSDERQVWTEGAMNTDAIAIDRQIGERVTKLDSNRPDCAPFCRHPVNETSVYDSRMLLRGTVGGKDASSRTIARCTLGC